MMYVNDRYRVKLDMIKLLKAVRVHGGTFEITEDKRTLNIVDALLAVYLQCTCYNGYVFPSEFW